MADDRVMAWRSDGRRLTPRAARRSVIPTTSSVNRRDRGDRVKILISGASGLVGRACASALLRDGHTVVRLLRGEGAPTGGAAVAAAASMGAVRWDPAAETINASAMAGTDAVLHFSGASIAERRWTPARKALLRSSRVNSTRVLVDAIARLEPKPRVFVCASAVGYYGNRGDEILTESSAPGDDFLAQLARDWEAEARRAEFGGVRTVLLRFGLILSREGGALPQMLRPFRLGLGGRFGNGQQWMSWIALEDVVGTIRATLEDERFAGPVNVVSPNPVRNAEFTSAVAATLHRPEIFAAPAFALRLALGEMADALLGSQRVLPERLLALSYQFEFPELAGALGATLAKHDPARRREN